MALTDIYVRDKYSGRIHRVGDDQHDSLWVDAAGTVHYHHLQNGDGCGPRSRMLPKERAGFEFVPSDCGDIFDPDHLFPLERHGRLIDADALIKSLMVDPMECPGCPEPEHLEEFIELLKNAPTVSPAEEEKK